jgi:hypothetical protein
VGDDRAITALMDYLESRQFDLSRIRNQGDYQVDPLTTVVDAMFNIAQRRRVSDLPSKWPGKFQSWAQYLQMWKAWWDGHKETHLSTAPYEDVADPTLRCLARTVDWGFADGLLVIAEKFGQNSASLLESFPRAEDFEPMGTIPGNLQAALGRVGDLRSEEQMANELQQGDSFLDALDKLQFVGGAQAVNALVGVLGVPTTTFERARRQKEECLSTFSEWKDNKQREFNVRRCDTVYESAERDYNLLQKSVLAVLSGMVKDPPLPSGTLPTPESFRTWKEWWEQNKDSATFPSSYLTE